MSPLEAQVALNMLPGIGPIRCRRLLDHFGSAADVLNANRSDWLEIRGIGPELATSLERWPQLVDPVAEIEACRQRGIGLITPQCANYPAALHEIYDAPILLYCMGGLDSADQQAIAVVGSRRCSHYGIHTTRKLSYQLAAGGQTIVSGLARGIDTAAHEAAIAAAGRTIAIIGSGLANLYPAENQALAERIADGHGAVISEYPLHTRPDKGTFPMRNRLIAACSQAVLVVECPDKSGSLITANLAAEYGRPVFVVPGQIDSANFIGSHRLIRDGATLVTDGQQIISDLGGIRMPSMESTTSGRADPGHLDSEQSMVLASLGQSQKTADEIIEACRLSTSSVTRSLAMLEIHGLVHSSPGGLYSRA